MKKAAMALGSVLLLIGAALFLVAFNFALADRETMANGLRAEGQVIAVEGYRNRQGKVFHRPIVSFVDHTGKTRQFVSSTGSNPPAYDRGDTVAVIYDPAKPQDAMIDSFAERHLGRLVFLVMGLFCAAMGAGIMLRART